MGKVQDLTNKKFNKLLVIERNYDAKRTSWFCKCDCGNDKLISVFANNLISGRTKSCGCERHRSRPRYRNQYDLSTYDYGVGYTKNKEEFYFDKEDYDKIKDFCWHLDKDNYVVACVTKNKKTTTIKMHRVIMNVSDPTIQVDHIYHVNYDNRKSKLRIITNQNNQRNRQVSSTNTSGMTGVSWNKREKRWRAYITINNKQINLGYYANIEDAIAARKAAEKEYFGEFAYKEKENE